jgi:hypothetical protein
LGFLTAAQRFDRNKESRRRLITSAAFFLPIIELNLKTPIARQQQAGTNPVKRNRACQFPQG